MRRYWNSASQPVEGSVTRSAAPKPQKSSRDEVAGREPDHRAVGLWAANPAETYVDRANDKEREGDDKREGPTDHWQSRFGVFNQP